jgi:hypothetical protein
MSKHNMIDRYVYAVGNQLSDKQRDDIQLELRSTLQDMLEARGLDAGADGDQAAIAALLKEFGSPYEIAASYRPNRYLIGPRYYPIYAQVLRIVAWIMIGVVTFATLIGGLSGQDVFEQIGNLFGAYTSALFQAGAIVTLIFVALERSGVADEDLEAEIAKGWDPLKLPEIYDADRVNYFEVIVELLFGLGFLVGLNAIFGILGPQAELVAEWEHTPDIIEEILPFVPYMIMLFGVEVALKSFVLLRGAWQRWTRWIEFGLSLADSVVLVLILLQAPFSVLSWLDFTVKISLVIALLIIGGTGLAQLYRLLWPERQPPWKKQVAG